MVIVEWKRSFSIFDEHAYDLFFKNFVSLTREETTISKMRKRTNKAPTGHILLLVLLERKAYQGTALRRFTNAACGWFFVLKSIRKASLFSFDVTKRVVSVVRCYYYCYSRVSSSVAIGQHEGTYVKFDERADVNSKIFGPVRF